MDYSQLSLELHKKYQGKISVNSKVPLNNRDDLSVFYTPGVAEPCRAIAKNPDAAYEYTSKGNLVAIISDGSAVLGLGNIGAEAAIPVMEGKCILFQKFAGLDAFPICLNTQDTEEIIRVVKAIEPSFGGINLEDISAPRCFEIEERLKKEMKIPVFHDDQHGTAAVVLAGLLNALQIVGKKMASIKIVISGAGAAGTAVAELLRRAGAVNIILCDRHGSLNSTRNDLNAAKKELLSKTNPNDEKGDLKSVLRGADVFIGVSGPGLLQAADIKTMAEKSIVFALANPTPEIMPEEAKTGGAFIVATGRSDYPNQLNNVLAFPGILKGAMQARKQISEEMILAAASSLAAMVKNPSAEKIIPGPFEEGIAKGIADAVMKA